MKYEVITDGDDLLVLVVNSRVIAISSDMSVIAQLMQDNYIKVRNKERVISAKALIHPELDNDEIKEDKVVIKEDKPAINLGNVPSLESLFGKSLDF